MGVKIKKIIIKKVEKKWWNGVKKNLGKKIKKVEKKVGWKKCGVKKISSKSWNKSGGKNTQY